MMEQDKKHSPIFKCFLKNSHENQKPVLFKYINDQVFRILGILLQGHMKTMTLLLPSNIAFYLLNYIIVICLHAHLSQMVLTMRNIPDLIPFFELSVFF